jgi:hypothetical protein
VWERDNPCHIEETVDECSIIGQSLRAILSPFDHMDYPVSSRRVLFRTNARVVIEQ